MQENSRTSEFDNDDLYEHYRFVASEGQVPLRVDKFLMNFIENATRNKIQQAAKAGNILVNGRTKNSTGAKNKTCKKQNKHTNYYPDCEMKVLQDNQDMFS